MRWTSYLLVAVFAASVSAGQALARETIWMPAGQAREVSPLAVKGSDVQMVEEDALGEFLTPIVQPAPGATGNDAWKSAGTALFQFETPKAGAYYLWARLRYPSAQPESFSVTVVGSDGKVGGEQILGGSRVGVDRWHWDSLADALSGKPGVGRLKLDVPAGRWTLRVCLHQGGNSVFPSLRWRQVEPAFMPRLNVLCLTDDLVYVPCDADACRATGLRPSTLVVPQVEPTLLPAVDAGQWRAVGHKPVPDFLRCPRFYTKDSCRRELAHRRPGDIARLVRQVAASGGQVLRLSVFWGGETYYPSRVAPHVPGLGSLDYLREAIDEGNRTGVRIVVYMNPNAMVECHPLFPECTIRQADGQSSTRAAYGFRDPAVRYACVNHPRYRRFLREVLTEIFTDYCPAGLYVDGLTPHVCFCEHCRAKYRQKFAEDMPVEKFAKLRPGWACWAEFGGDPQPVGDVANDRDARRLTELLYDTFGQVTDEFTATVKGCKPDAVTLYHSHPKANCRNDYDGTLTEVFSPRPWVHTAWRCGELAGYSTVYHVPVLFNIYPHQHYTADEARYLAYQGLANGAYPNFWSTPGMAPVFRFMKENARYLDFATTVPVRSLALPRDLHTDATQNATPSAVSYAPRDRFLAPYVGAYSALTRAGLPVVTLHRPHFEEHLLVRNSSQEPLLRAFEPASSDSKARGGLQGPALGYQVLVLANVTNLSDTQVEAVREFVRSGGGLIATHETSLADAKGRRRDDFALADVLGVHYRRTLPAAARAINFARSEAFGKDVGDYRELTHDEPHVVVTPEGATSIASLSHGDPAGADVPAALLHTFGRGRVVYLPGRLDSIQCYRPDKKIERLFSDAAEWVSGQGLPISVEAPGPVGVTLFRQSERFIVHLVNHDRDSQLRSTAWRPLEGVVLHVQVPRGFRLAGAVRLASPKQLAWNTATEPIRIEVGRLDEYDAVVLELRPSL